MPATVRDAIPVVNRSSIGSDGTNTEVSVPTASFLLAASAANTNAQAIATGKRQGFTVTGINTAAAIRYLKLYNKASTPVPASDTPVLVLAIPASKEFQFNLAGFYFSTGIGIVIVAGAANTDTTAGALGDIVGLCISFGSLP